MRSQHQQGIEASTHGLWAATAPVLQTEPLSGDSSADVAVIGAGYTGLSAALHAREHGLSVVVLDAADVGFGGAGRNVGLVNAGLWLQPNDVLKALGKSYGERLIAELGRAPQVVFELIECNAIACEANPKGTLHCAVGRKGVSELEQRFAQWRELGAPVELLTREQTVAEVGSTAFAASLLDRRAGTIQPLAYARGLATAAMRQGAHIYSQTPVQKVEQERARWKLSTSRGSVLADWVVVATDAYTKGPWAEVRQEQVALPYFNLATKPLSPALRESILPSRRGAWDTQSVLTSFRLDDAGRLIFGSVGALRSGGAAVHKAFSRRALRTLFPQLAAVEFEHAWYGTIGMTADSIPRFHRFAPNVLGISGYNGRGIGPGTVFGRLLAQHVAGKLREDEMPLPVSPVQSPKLRHLKEWTYEYGAQLAHLFASR
ncbi:NAD(P)/FAD-dependent oxidoreductase [Steroidobacter sp.]|uniref:NAD(P)/FAD-dependent oxidoreductase n=1 Tax=Steroidobacter sp. TaxID=1978227 RepID=UPI001A44D121|nr:FAD-binding oxidoreductase [Steroidobacter sp.]MBL8266067.1 FAD-binding oxidoreductase [Steroidobacter sp.]